ncbi:MAG: TIGR02444 family protein [Rhodoferax sp.]|uniref:TIGR02444 family protein n=1 Tax=Rhodoferax sp. TaxID=50421 RepID=UPI0027312D6B|nr:TIGR02444 family protein [Rhodoferax sp.]MDP1528584.1 TIGR02444 family protein [Rhodoferax sp.]
MSVWDWVLTAYAADGVADACLELQDSAGQNIPLLLWAAWCAAEGRVPDEDALEAAGDTARAWQDTAIAPLRAVRRALKPRAPDLDDTDREAVRAQVKAVELEAERCLLIALETLAPAPSGPPQPPITALVAAARAWSPMTPRAGLVRLADRLPA